MIRFDSWHGEFGWEIMSWAPLCRKQAQDHSCSVATSFPGMAPLYADFAEFEAHDATSRSLTYPKTYRVGDQGLFHKYGTQKNAVDVLIHVRQARRKANINYLHWGTIMDALRGFRVGVVGTAEDGLLKGAEDFRCLPLQELMDIMAGAAVTVGCSSGVMHLAAACGCNLVVWGDNRTYFSETLEKRYKETWNPFRVDVGYASADDWQPEPRRVLDLIGDQVTALSKGP